MTEVALVTGAAGGIGGAIVDRLIEAGYVVVAGDVQPSPHESAAVQPVTLDVRSNDSVAATVDAAATLGRLHAVVNCAGILRETPIDRSDERDVDAVTNVNLVGTMRVCRLASPHLDGGAAIVNIGSLAGSAGSAPAVSAYAASKGGVESYTRALACELGGRRVRVNVVAPGFVRAPMSELMRSDGDERLARKVPLGRLGEPQEIAEVVEFLLSDRASYVTGVVVHVDGGVLAK